MKYALISTEKGDMKVELYEKETPITVANFVKLAEPMQASHASISSTCPRMPRVM